MSLLGKLMDTMRLSPEEEEDDYYLDDDFEEEAPRKGLFTKKGTEYEDEEESDKPRFLGRLQGYQRLSPGRQGSGT